MEAFDSGFNSYKSLVGKLSPNLDLSSITKEVGLTLAIEMEIQPTLEVDSAIEVPQPTLEALAVLLKPKVEDPDPINAPVSTPAQTLASTPTPNEVISLEDDSAIPALAKAPQVDA